MNYLQLFQQLAADTGTVDGSSQPTTVVGQTRYLGKMARWVNMSWRSIQNAHGTWLWMEGEFSGNTVPGQQRYTGADMGVASRFGQFICRGDGDEDRFSIYDPSIGLADEGAMRFLNWREFYTLRTKGDQSNFKRPNMFSIAPDGRICLSPIPDKVYVVRGPYRKDVQDLTNDVDIPEMPARFHDLIVDAAQIYAATHDEAAFQIPLARLRHFTGFGELERDQLPQVRIEEFFA